MFATAKSLPGEAIPTRHVLDELVTKPFALEVLAGHRKLSHLEVALGCDSIGEVMMQDGDTPQGDIVEAFFDALSSLRGGSDFPGESFRALGPGNRSAGFAP